MNFITGKQMPRRTFLRGAMGASVALPFLDAMVAARGLGAPGAERTRLLAIEEVHGLPGCNKWGASKFLFAPEQVGHDFTMVNDSALKSLATEATIRFGTAGADSAAFAAGRAAGCGAAQPAANSRMIRPMARAL